MVKRKSQNFEPEEVSSKPTKVKKNKKIKKEIVQEVEVKSSKKNKLKDVSQLILQEDNNSISPKKQKNKHKKDSVENIDNSVLSSPKKVKHKHKVHATPVKIEHLPSHVGGEVDEYDVVVLSENEKDSEIDLTEIPRGDLEALLRGIQKEIPSNDSLMSKTRCRKLNWAKIAFGDYSPDKCIKIWEAIQKCQRSYRLLSELVADAMVWLDAPWRSAMHAKASKNHPDFPKRPKSSFLLFLEENRSKILQEHKDIKTTEISRMAGLMFKQLSESEKTRYVEQAAKKMRLYEQQVKLFYEKHPHLKSETIIKPTGPKKPPTPFQLFLEDHLSKEKNITDKSAYRVASKGAWDNMKMKKKLPWIRRAFDEYKKYIEEVEVYNFEHPNEAIKPLKKLLTKEERLYLDKSDGKPAKPPTSAYLLFSQNLLHSGELLSISAKDRVKIIAARWRDLDKAEKDLLEEQLQKLQEAYKKEFKIYYNTLPEEERAKLDAEVAKKKKLAVPKAEVSRRKSLSKKDVSVGAMPKNWMSMTEEDKEVYMAALNRVREYFDNKLNESMDVIVPKAQEVCKNESDNDTSESEDSDEESD